MSEKYYVLTSSCDGTSLREYYKEDLLGDLNDDEGGLADDPEQPWLSEVPNNGFWCMGDKGGMLIIKGEVVTPKPVYKVKEYDLP